MSSTTPPHSTDILEGTSTTSKVFGHSPKTRILDYFLNFPANDFTKKDIIGALKMSKQTFYKYFDDLEELGLLKVNRTIGKAKLYTINLDNPVVKMIQGMECEMSAGAIDEPSAQPGAAGNTSSSKLLTLISSMPASHDLANSVEKSMEWRKALRINSQDS